MKLGTWKVIAVVLAVAACTAPGDGPVANTAPARAPATAPAAAPAANEALPKSATLRNPGFELESLPGERCAAGWRCTMHSDPNSFRFFVDASDGRRGYCMEPVKKEPWATVTQASFDKSLRGARLRFSVALRLADVAGAGAGPWAQVRSPQQHPQTYGKQLKGSTQWESHAIEFDVPQDAESVTVGLTLNGTGRACFDDARLEVLRAAKNPV